MNTHQRRDFLKLAAAGVIAPPLLNDPTSNADSGGARSGDQHSAIPTVETMGSVTMSHRFGDLFNPPGLTNQWGCAQAAMDVAAIRSIAFPPFAQGEMNVAPVPIEKSVFLSFHTLTINTPQISDR